MDTRWSAAAIFAWAMVLLGIFFPILWVVAAMMPFCFGSSLWVRRAALAAASAACCYLILAVIILPATLVTRSRQPAYGGGGYRCDQYGNCRYLY